MKDWIKRSLTRKVSVKGPRRGEMIIEVEPSERLVYGITFAIVALAALTAIQVAHIIVLKELNSEIISTMTLLIGTIIGVFFGKKT